MNFSGSGALCVSTSVDDIQSFSFREKLVSHLFYKWSIMHFASVTLGYKQSINSPDFRSTSIPTTWFLKHFPVPITKQRKRSRFYLCRAKTDTEPEVVVVTYQIGVKVYSETTWFPEKRSVLFRPGNESEVEVNIREYFRTDYDINQDRLTILCEMYITLPKTENLAIASCNEWRTDQVHLSVDLLNSISLSKLCDTELLVRNVKFSAHKSILSARSPIFEQACLNLGERIRLMSDDYDHIYCLLTYIYSGNPYLALENRDLCIGLFECAKRYSVSGLQHLLYPIEIKAHTTVMDEDMDFEWCIEGIGSLIEGRKTYESSPAFPCKSKVIPETVFRFCISQSLRSTYIYGIYVRAQMPVNALHLKITFCILDSNMQEHFKRVIEYTDVLFDEHGIPDYINSDQLLENKNLLKNDKLMIKCYIQLTLLEEYVSDEIPIVCLLYDEHLKSLSEDCEKLLQNGLFSDVKVVIEEEIFQLHKVILATRCPKLESQLKEKDGTDCVIGITDLSTQIFSEMVMYMYTGKISVTSSHLIIKLYTAAEDYKMKLLANICSRMLRTLLDCTSIFDAITLAYKYDDKELLNDSLRYVSINQSEILPSVEWNNLIDSHTDLLARLKQWTHNI